MTNEQVVLVWAATTGCWMIFGMSFMSLAMSKPEDPLIDPVVFVYSGLCAIVCTIVAIGVTLGRH